MVNYKNKYLKYKLKYVNLIGGIRQDIAYDAMENMAYYRIEAVLNEVSDEDKKNLDWGEISDYLEYTRDGDGIEIEEILETLNKIKTMNPTFDKVLSSIFKMYDTDELTGHLLWQLENYLIDDLSFNIPLAGGVKKS
jgi:uncharacterized membrane protein YheB (UPF0754 family)